MAWCSYERHATNEEWAHLEIGGGGRESFSYLSFQPIFVSKLFVLLVFSCGKYTTSLCRCCRLLIRSGL